MYRDNFGSVKKIWVDEDVVGKLILPADSRDDIKAFVLSLKNSYYEKKEKRLKDGSYNEGDGYTACLSLFVPEYLVNDLCEVLDKAGLDELSDQVKK